MGYGYLYSSFMYLLICSRIYACILYACMHGWIDWLVGWLVGWLVQIILCEHSEAGKACRSDCQHDLLVKQCQ